MRPRLCKAGGNFLPLHVLSGYQASILHGEKGFLAFFIEIRLYLLYKMRPLIYRNIVN